MDPLEIDGSDYILDFIQSFQRIERTFYWRKLQYLKKIVLDFQAMLKI